MQSTTTIRIDDFDYLNVGGVTLSATLYRPPGSGFPAVVDVHGGRWINNDRFNNREIAVHLAQNGIAVLSIGYADGFLRHFGNGNASVKIHGQWAPTIGNICMDMCFVDVSHILDAQEGDEVIIFDSIEMIEHLAEAMETISYEILTNISGRVPRVFFED